MREHVEVMRKEREMSQEGQRPQSSVSMNGVVRGEKLHREAWILLPCVHLLLWTRLELKGDTWSLHDWTNWVDSIIPSTYLIPDSTSSLRSLQNSSMVPITQGPSCYT